MKKFKVVSLCGSMRFTKEMINLQHDLSKKGMVCLLPAFSLEDDGQNIDKDLKEQYRDMHFQRIDMSDAVHFVIVDEYIGPSTQIELDYARKHNKEIIFNNYSRVGK